MALGLGSNMIVRDGGMPGVVVRLGKPFATVAVEDDCTLLCGGGASGILVSSTARDAGIAGLEFLRGIPGTVGGFVRMNGGAYGTETKNILIEARGVDRAGTVRIYTNADMHFSYRHCGVPDDVVFTQALYQGRLGDPAAIAGWNALPFT